MSFPYAADRYAFTKEDIGNIVASSSGEIIYLPGYAVSEVGRCIINFGLPVTTTTTVVAQPKTDVPAPTNAPQRVPVSQDTFTAIWNGTWTQQSVVGCKKDLNDTVGSILRHQCAAACSSINPFVISTELRGQGAFLKIASDWQKTGVLSYKIPDLIQCSCGDFGVSQEVASLSTYYNSSIVNDGVTYVSSFEIESGNDILKFVAPEIDNDQCTIYMSRVGGPVTLPVTTSATQTLTSVTVTSATQTSVSQTVTKTTSIPSTTVASTTAVSTSAASTSVASTSVATTVKSTSVPSTSTIASSSTSVATSGESTSVATSAASTSAETAVSTPCSTVKITTSTPCSTSTAAKPVYTVPTVSSDATGKPTVSSSSATGVPTVSSSAVPTVSKSKPAYTVPTVVPVSTGKPTKAYSTIQYTTPVGEPTVTPVDKPDCTSSKPQKTDGPILSGDIRASALSLLALLLLQ
ncbi:hypothetical protein EDD86DRAFT_205475 [Gorgonomyces haynaldii]|nr:hypothetical protein EDD86DRAFT_205475 [Gorgonomyces haynaldii]